MAQAKIQPSFAAGELSPSLYGRVDLAKYHIGCSTLRNMFVNYRGGASSRAGTAYVGMSLQTILDPSVSPRLIPFQFNVSQGYVLEFGNLYMRVIADGGYVTETAKTITGASQANPCQITAASHGYANNDWVYISGVVGMTALNGRTFIVQGVTTNTFTLTDLFGDPINSTGYTAYSSGGTAARIYTVVAPYADTDLPILKFTQSADVMTLTHPSYVPTDLTRSAINNWSFATTSFSTSISAPATCSVATSDSHGTTQYAYVVTAVNNSTGEESVASPIGVVSGSADIAVTPGVITVTWSAVPGANYYNVYKAPPAYSSTSVPIGALYGFAGSAFGSQFIDSNITQDFSKTPPLHNNPFATGAAVSINITAVGSGYTGTPTVTINTTTGSGAVLTPVVVSGQLQAVIVVNAGSGYKSTDTVSITGGAGSGATATLTVGPQTGTYPSVCAYFQERRVYANSLNNPDTYWMSQPGAFKNFDDSIPVIDSDAITGTPWAQQVNGISALVPMPGGLVVLTGQGSWQLSGSGGAGSAISPASQAATPQAFNGCSPVVPPIRIGQDIVYVQQKNSVVRDLSYNFFTSIYTGTDLTVLSNHLFTGYSILEWAWAEEPYKVVWAVRDDGAMLGLTYLKDQDVYGWSRHDTNGLFLSVCSVSEPPVDAVYVVVKRYVSGQSTWVYYVERFDNRLWAGDVEDAWCVDAGLTYPQTFPNATLTPSAASGTLGILSVTVISGGSNYTNPNFTITDRAGGKGGTGATFSATLSGGVITTVTPVTPGSKYVSPVITIQDSTGTGAVVNAVINNTVTVTASASVFSAGMVGNVIRVGGGIGTITQYLSGTQVVINLTQDITSVLTNNSGGQPIPAASGDWSISVPTTTVTGLDHLEGMTVTGLADGNVISPTTVSGGSITLPQAASAITVGLPFTAQVQSLYLDAPGGDSIQGKRKDMYAVTVRLESSRGMEVGSNQIDASTQPNQAPQPWVNMKESKERNGNVYAGINIPLFTGDERVNIPGTWRKNCQVAVQQQFPLPLNVIAVVSEDVIGDSPG